MVSSVNMAAGVVLGMSFLLLVFAVVFIAFAILTFQLIFIVLGLFFCIMTAILAHLAMVVEDVINAK